MRSIRLCTLGLSATSVLAVAVPLGQLKTPATAHKPPSGVPVTLGNGQSVPLNGTTSAITKALAGPVVQDKSYPLQLKGSGGVVQVVLHDRVVKEKTSGTLDFYSWVSVSGSLGASGLTIQRSGFSGAVEVEYRKDGVGAAAPSTAKRSGDGSTISFEFQNANLTAGSRGATRSCFVKTGATRFAQSGTTTVSLNGAPGVSTKTANPQ